MQMHNNFRNITVSVDELEILLDDDGLSVSDCFISRMDTELRVQLHAFSYISTSLLQQISYVFMNTIIARHRRYGR